MPIPLEDLIIERLRRSGPGGQHRNKKSTGIRIVHLPTGITVMATERRSQAQNFEVAMERLIGLLEKRSRKPKPRIKTTPTKSAKEKRLRAKAERSRTKGLRRSVNELD